MLLREAFLSVVTELRSGHLEAQLAKLNELGGVLASETRDFEIVVIANGLSISEFEQVRSAIQASTNTMVLRLTGSVNTDVATFAGLRNCIGDFVAAVELLATPVDAFANLLRDENHATNVLTAVNTSKSVATAVYRMQFRVFNSIFQRINKYPLDLPGTVIRVFSRAVINQVMQEPDPVAAIRHIPQLYGFDRTEVSFEANVPPSQRKRSAGRASRGWSFLVSTSGMPLRLVTSIAIFGALVNIAYAAYVLYIAITDKNVQPGWVSTSLQLSGMFFLLSCSLGVLGEYILNLTKQTIKAPTYHLAEEISSKKSAGYQQINVKLDA